MNGMQRLRFTDRLLLPPALLAVLVADRLWPAIRTWGMRVARWGPLARLHRRVSRLPPGVALPLFLVPEACSRLGWVAAGWLVLKGEPWRALAVYAGTKLMAGSAALWIWSACLPSLLRVRPFARAHATLMGVRHRVASWSAWRGGRLTNAMAQVRARRVRARNAAAGPASAIPSGPAGPSRTG